MVSGSLGLNDGGRALAPRREGARDRRPEHVLERPGKRITRPWMMTIMSREIEGISKAISAPP